jgi:FkbM family methyltransferase
VTGVQHERPVAGDRLVTASALKIQTAQFLGGAGAGRVIGAVCRKRVRHQGLWFDVSSSDFSPGVRARMFWGFYEGAESRMIRAFLRGSPTVVELGSSLGVTAAHAASVMPRDGHLVCVEANPRLVPGLRERVVPGAASLRVDVIHAAIDRHCGTSELCITAETVSSRVGDERPGAPTVRVPALTLREILRMTNVAEFALISDIEGAEAAFLVSDPSVLDNCGRAIIELHNTTLDGEQISVFDLVDAAVRLGFRVVDQHGPVVALARG